MSQPTASPSGLSDKPTVKHSRLTRIFHHSSAFFILVLWGLGEFSDELAQMIKTHPIAIHKAIGVIFLLWLTARLINAIFRRRLPTLGEPKWQVAIAHLVHFGLYACMFGMAMSGVMMSMYGGRPIDVFGLFSIPVFVTPNRQMASLINEIHTDVIFPSLIVLILAHIGGALYHQFVLKDGVLSRIK